MLKFLIKYYLKKNLNSNEKIEFDKAVSKFEIDLEKFRYNEIKLLYVFQKVTVLGFFIDYIILIWKLIPPLFWFSGIFPFFVSLFSTYKLYKKEMEFLNNYDFSLYSSNVSKLVFRFFYLYIKKSFFGTFLLIFFCGFSLLNGIIYSFTGYNPLRELGMYYGLHKDSPNYIGRDNIVSTENNILENNNKEKE